MSNSIRGKFLTLEGTEGVGKSTNLEFIQNYLRERGVSVVVTREPGGTPLAEELRDILLANRDEQVESTAELLLVFAARAQHLNTVILPALMRGDWVLCDRFTDATFAYQGYGRGLNKSQIMALEQLVQGGLRPDKTFLLDIDPALGLQRAKVRAELDRFENEQIPFFERVRAGYLARVEENPNLYAVIDASKPLLEVQSSIERALKSLL